MSKHTKVRFGAGYYKISFNKGEAEENVTNKQLMLLPSSAKIPLTEFAIFPV